MEHCNFLRKTRGSSDRCASIEEFRIITQSVPEVKLKTTEGSSGPNKTLKHVLKSATKVF